MRRLAGSVSLSSGLGELRAEYRVSGGMPEYMKGRRSLQRESEIPGPVE